MNVIKRTNGETTAQARRRAADVAFSRMILIGSVVVFVVVVVADALYVSFLPRRHGHLMLPAMVFVAPLVAAGLIPLALWNWRVMRRRSKG